jgi:hypothetical protein
MSRSHRLLGCVLMLALTLGLAWVGRPEDPVTTNPGKYKTIFENDRVRLLEFQDKPGDVTVMHHHPSRLVYSLAPWKKRFRFPDGGIAVAKGKTGDATWAEAGDHAGENIGDTPTHILIFELKEPRVK